MVPPPDAKPILAPAPAPALVPGQTPSTITSVGANTVGTSTQSAPRPRQQGRKKAVPIEPDPLYRGASTSAATAGHGPPGLASAGAKRGAQDRADGEPRKRKRVDHHTGTNASASAYTKQTANTHMHGHGHAGATGRAGAGSAITNVGGYTTINGNNFTGGGSNSAGPLWGPDADGQASLFDFSSLPTSALYEYITQFDLVPVIYPTPLSAEDPPPPIALLDPARMASRAPTPTRHVTPANRPRRNRESKEAAANRRRSTRLLEEELRGGGLGGGLEQVPVLADVGALHGVLAGIAGRHFRESSVREVDTLASFVGAVRARRQK